MHRSSTHGASTDWDPDSFGSMWAKGDPEEPGSQAGPNALSVKVFPGPRNLITRMSEFSLVL